MVTIIILITCGQAAYAQSVTIIVRNKPLNSVLIELRETHNLELSFNDKLLSGYFVTTDTIFSTPSDAISSLISRFPLSLEMRNNVFVISTAAGEGKEMNHVVEGKITDASSGKSLPYSHVSLNNKWTEADPSGRFFMSLSEPPPYSLKVSYLGYYMLDTIIGPGSGYVFDLQQADYNVGEVIIPGKKVLRSIQGGKNAGETNLNHHIAGYLPGNGDNSVFNLLRLQPGICAAGELANDLIIWGSYEGQSRVLFDGFPIFGLKNYNENISAVNPFLVQEIKVFRGGFGPQYGGKVGGIVDITGVEGARETPEIKFSVNNLTMNGFLSVPLGDKVSFIMAGRITYRDLYESTNTSLFASNRRNKPGKNASLTVYPEYFFRDINFKLNGEAGKGDTWNMNYFTGGDKFAYTADATGLLRTVKNDSDERNTQDAASFSYNKRWGGGNVTRVTTSWSQLFNDRSELIDLRRRSGDTLFFRDEHLETSVSETGARIEHFLPFSAGNQAEFGIDATFDRISFSEDTSGVELPSERSNSAVFGAYIADNIQLGKNVFFKPGLRTEYYRMTGKFYLQPRVSMTIGLTDKLRIKTSLGRYNQYMVLNPVIDLAGNFHYKWTISDGNPIPVVTSDHLVAGISWSDSGLEISAETYLKSTDGLSRALNFGRGRWVFTGNGRGRGMDLFIRKDIRGSTVWASLSVGRTEEHFSYFAENEYRRAPHDQLLELKLAGVLNLNPFHFSGSYVHGSGFSLTAAPQSSAPRETPYDRLDLSAVYRFERKTYLFEAGLSLLNVFNTENIKYSNFTVIPVAGSDPFSIHAEAVPRMLTLFINFIFGE